MKCENGEIVIVYDEDVEFGAYRVQYFTNDGTARDNFGFDKIFNSYRRVLKHYSDE